MLNRLESYCYQVSRELGQFDQQQWMIVFCLAVVVGAFLLRGYGTRT
jgi:hypothetical protein